MPFEGTWTPIGSRPLKYVVMIIPRGFLASFLVPLTALTARPNQNVQMSTGGGEAAGAGIPWTPLRS